jgi:hypothetical protein
MSMNDDIIRTIRNDARIGRAFKSPRLVSAAEAHAIRMATRRNYRQSVDDAIGFAIDRVRDDMARFQHGTGCQTPFEAAS